MKKSKEAKEALESADHWDRLADEETARSEYEHAIGIHPQGIPSAHDNKAATFRATAKALRLEAETGTPHCSCHFVAVDRCPSNPRNKSYWR